MFKRVWIIVIFSFLVLSTILFSFAYFNSISYDDTISDLTYDISVDTVPLSVVQPSSFAWRVVDGLVQRQNGFGTWAPATLGLDQLFNDYGIATLSDVQAASMTIPDMISAFSQYFGSYPNTATVYGHGNPNYGEVYYNPSNFYDLISRFIEFSTFNQVSPAGTSYLNSSGLSSQTDLSRTSPYFLSQGFLGLSRNLLGSSGFSLFVDSIGNLSSVSNLLSGLSLIDSNLYAWLNGRGDISFLGQDGTVLSINGSSIEQDVRFGFLGLANLLRGVNTSSGVPMTFFDYTTGQPESAVLSGSLFDLNATGFEAIQNLLALYLYSHGTDLDIRERENMQEQAETFVNEFTSSSGSGTPTTDNVSDSAHMSGSVRDLFSSSSSVADAFVQLGSSGNYSYFTQATANELEPSSVVNSYSRYDDGYRDLFSDKLSSIFYGGGSSW